MSDDATMTTLLTPSKSELLRRWMRERGIFRTHEIIAWGLQNYYNRANRVKGQFHHDGLIRQLPKEEKILRGFTTAEGIYEYVGDNNIEANHV